MKKKVNASELSGRDQVIVPVYSDLDPDVAIPKYELSDHELSPRTAASLVQDEIMLDGNARLNLATFLTTWMEPEARALMAEAFDRNIMDKDEYPQTAEIENRCVSILANLWNSPDHEDAIGTSTIGSSEAAMLGGMALKWRWRERQRAEGKPTDKPNLVMGINVQVCWDKFCRYWDIEPRQVPMEGDRYHIGVDEAIALCDENTIGVVAIMGSTFDGSYEPVQELSTALDDLDAKTGLDVPIHVDGASGAFTAPFLDPHLEWDFRVPRVVSINTSGHKYGLVYPGVGWIVWRRREYLSDDLIFKVNYLGGEEPTFAISFSRPGNTIIGQYYNFLRLGRPGHTRIYNSNRDVAMYLASKIEDLGPFELITRGDEAPVFAFKLADDVENYSVFDISERLRDRGWQVPAYTFPKNREDLAALRIVVRRGFSHDMADLLLGDLERHLEYFAQRPGHVPAPVESSFHH